MEPFLITFHTLLSWEDSNCKMTKAEDLRNIGGPIDCVGLSDLMLEKNETIWNCAINADYNQL